MKISHEPTDHIMVKANTTSEWDKCDFTLITCDEYWKKMMKKRFEAVKSFPEDYDFKHFAYHDGSADFYVAKKDETETLFAELQEKKWTFVTLEEGEQESFDMPENRLDAYSLFLCKDGTGFYKAYGKYSGEEFYTAELPFGKILEMLNAHD